MSVKIKINWDNENVVFESVRIYRSNSGFTSTSLPPLLTEIVGDVYEYEDLTTVENQTYFYMLSCFLGEQEVFTECFEVLASTVVFVEFEKVNGFTRNIAGPINSGLHIGASFPNKDGTVLYAAMSDGSFRKYVLSSPHYYTDLLSLNYTVIKPFGVSTRQAGVSFYNSGKKAIVRTQVTSSNFKYSLYEFSEAYNIENCSLIASFTSTAYYNFWFPEDGGRLFSLAGKIVTEHNFSITEETLIISTKENKTINIPQHNSCQIIVFGSDGLTGIFTDYLSGSYSRIVSFKLSSAYDVSTCTNSSVVSITRPVEIPAGLFVSPGWSNRHIYSSGDQIYALNTITGSGSNPSFYFDIFKITSIDW